MFRKNVIVFRGLKPFYIFSKRRKFKVFKTDKIALKNWNDKESWLSRNEEFEEFSLVALLLLCQ